MSTIGGTAPASFSVELRRAYARRVELKMVEGIFQ
jgi:hypothetical protein